MSKPIYGIGEKKEEEGKPKDPSQGREEKTMHLRKEINKDQKKKTSSRNKSPLASKTLIQSPGKGTNENHRQSKPNHLHHKNPSLCKLCSVSTETSPIPNRTPPVEGAAA
jgi:hypothetical protein